jgi:hypothetical protein
MEFRPKLVVVQEINPIIKRGHKYVNKSSSIIYCCFIHNFVEHKVYDYLHKDTIQLMFKEKVMVVAPKKDNVDVNMVLHL